MYLVIPMHSNDLICDILEYIDDFIYTKITIEDLEHRFYYNRYYIMKLFKKEIGITIFDYINKLRINTSIQELNNTSNLLIKIAINNGFYSLEYYSEMFKKEIGISPRTYRKLISSKYIYNDKLEQATANIIKINKIINSAIKYKENRKRSVMPVKKLSIFI